MLLTRPLLQLLVRLDSSARRFSASEIAALLAHPLSPADLAPFARFDARDRCRTVIHRAEEYELVVIGWMPGQESSIHDHGDSHCGFRVMQGEAIERIFLQSSFARRAHGAADRSVLSAVRRPGTVSLLEPGEIHQVGSDARAAEPLVTLHLYSPPLERWRRYWIGRPRRPVPRHVAILGGGFSGAALAVHLRRAQGGEPLRVTLIDSSPRPGRGLAYEAEPCHLLNVSAGRMSMLPDTPDHFFTFAQAKRPQATRGSFLPRSLYGDYIESCLADVSGESLDLIHGEVVDLSERRAGFDLNFKDGRRIFADRVVLATGHGRPATPREIPASVRAHPRYVENPHARDALADLRRDERILVVGTGLTMIDVLLSLQARGHAGPVLAISRHGCMPAPHLPPQPARGAPAMSVLPVASIRELMRAIRDAVRAAEADGLPWQSVLDALRGSTPALWGRLPVAERRRFLEHVRSYWEVHRHRAPREVLAVLEARRAQGGFETWAARLVTAEPVGDLLRVTLRRRGEEAPITQSFDRVLNATGPDPDLARSGSPLLRTLLARGQIAQDPLRLGLITDEHGAAARRHGSLHSDLFVIGPARRARSWEATAVPEIAAQAAALARLLCADSVALLPEERPLADYRGAWI
jgi:uncharacterized NAD(P)/FAD-binding protein YdhS